MFRYILPVLLVFFFISNDMTCLQFTKSATSYFQTGYMTVKFYPKVTPIFFCKLNMVLRILDSEVYAKAVLYFHF